MALAIRALAFLAIILLCLYFGFFRLQMRVGELVAPVVTEKTGVVTVEGILLEVTERQGVVRWKLGDLSFSRSFPVPIYVRVTVRTKVDPTIEVGDRIRVRAGLLPLPGPREPGGFDFRVWAFYQQIGAVGYVVAPPRLVKKAERSGVLLWFERVRQQIVERLFLYLDERQAAVAAALLVGRRDYLDKETMRLIREGGLAHLLAISGLHLTLVVGLVFGVLRVLLCVWVPVRSKQWAAAGAMIGGAWYLLLAGMPVSAVRAYVMVFLVLLAIMLGRMVTPMRLVALAALVIIVVRPEWVLGVSFQLSFAAVVALILFFGWFSKWMERPEGWGYRFGYYLLCVMLSSVVATCATAPLVWWYFDTVSVWGVITNMVALPLASFVIMPGLLLGLLLMPLGLEGLPLWGVGLGVEVILLGLEWVLL